ncbi:hypothetical protein [Nocardia rhizosphaerae]|uniref:Lipoprotein n=1 Tax=Nocardia rhizosphaerae TaxID=1691571 RepID=A0ABV8L4L5_9NOCA
MGVASESGRAWIAGAMAAAALLMAGCGTEPTALPAITPDQPDATSVFAYRTTGELAVFRDGDTVHATGSFGYSADAVSFTADGRFAFAVESSTGTLVAVRVRDGAVSRTDCDCAVAVGLRDAVVGWWREPGQLMSLDLAGTEPAGPERDVTLPDSPSPRSGGDFDGARLVAATPDYLLVARVESQGLWWEKTHLYAIGPDVVLPLGRVPGIDADLSAAAGPDGHTFVLAGSTARSATCGTGHVATIDVRTNAVRELPVLPGECSVAYSPRWGADDTITVATRKWADTPGAPSAVDRLQSAAQGWAPLAEQPVVDMLPRMRRSTVQVVAGDPVDARAIPHGVLVLEHDGTRTELADQVVALGTPAARQG